MAMAAVASPRFPLCSASPRSIPSTEKKHDAKSNRKRREADRGPIREVLRVVARDSEFIGEGVRLVGEKSRPLRERISRSVKEKSRPLRERISRSVGDFLWMRHLEDPKAADEPLPPSSLPEISYPPGLSGMDLLMADLGALNVYFSYIRHTIQVFAIPLPEVYEPERIAAYFSCRPHILLLRMLEVFSSFAFAVIKMQTSRSFKINSYGVDTDHSSDPSAYYTGQLLKESMLNLGPAFIKVGQSLSTRPDIIGSEISEALSELHEKIPPFPRVTAMKIIEEEFGCPTQNIFSYISEEPVAAASFGQVYRGCTLDGFMVAIKVQRPNLLHTVMRDVYILRLGLGLLRKVAKRKSDLTLYADELGKGLVGELDYTLEAANAAKFLEAHSQYKFMIVPKVFRHLTRKRVLTMEWLVGESPYDLLLQSRGGDEKVRCSERQQLEAKTRLLDLVSKGVEASLVQLLETGLLHADPHPGNLRYTAEGGIGFLDFGLLCQMEKRHQFAMLAAIMHIVNGDWEALVYDLTLMDVVRPGTNLRRVTMELEDSLGEVVFRDGMPDIKFSRVLGKIWSVALKYHFRMPPYFTLVLRSIASLEGLAIAGNPQFKTFQAAYPFVVRKLLYDNSASTRTILYSVVFNRKREFQWQKILLFLKVGSLRKSTHGSNSASSQLQKHVEGDVVEVSNQILKLLCSKHGAVLRRLIFSANAVSLTRSLLSKDAAVFRKHVGKALADMIYRLTLETLGGGKAQTVSDYHFTQAERQQERDSSLPSTSSALLLQNALSDRRLRVIFFKMARDVQKHPMLMLRASWCCCVVFATAVAVAFHRIVVYWSEKLLRSVTFVPRRFAVTG